MTYFRNHHLAIAAVLFAMAIAMYAVGLRLGAAVVLVLGAAVELAAVSYTHLTLPTKA